MIAVNCTRDLILLPRPPQLQQWIEPVNLCVYVCVWYDCVCVCMHVYVRVCTCVLMRMCSVSL